MRNHKRLKQAAPLLATAITHLARISPSWCDQLHLIDATPVLCGTSRATVKRSDLAGHAGYGYCVSHSRFYWGLKLYLLANPDRMPITWCLANPKLGERDVCLDLMITAIQDGYLAPGVTVLADKDLAGRQIEGIAHLGLSLLHQACRDERARHGNLSGARQWIESTFDALIGQFGLERHGARTTKCVGARVAQPLLAVAAAVWPKWKPTRPASAVSSSMTTEHHLHGTNHLVRFGRNDGKRRSSGQRHEEPDDDRHDNEECSGLLPAESGGREGAPAWMAGLIPLPWTRPYPQCGNRGLRRADCHHGARR